MSTTARHPLSFRIRSDDLKAIDQQARQHGLNRTEYIVRASLHKLGSVGLDDRVNELEQRIEALERRVDLGYE